jgi:hypothetical protein
MTCIIAVGNAFCALGTSEGGAGDPPKSNPSNGYPTRELSTMSDTIVGTLSQRIVYSWILQLDFTYPPATVMFSVLIKL